MDCRQIESQLAQLSADDISASAATAIWEHLTRCPECQQEWRMFQTTLLVLSTTAQPLLTSEQSDQIWQNCSKQLHERIEQRRLAAQRPAFFNWVLNQPRWGWAALGGAMAVFGGVWLSAPQDSQDAFNNQLNNQVAQILPGQAAGSFGMGAMDSAEVPSPGPLITFQKPPANATSMVNNHTVMAFDPFVDHVGTDLISNEAIARRVNAQTTATVPVAPANDAPVTRVPSPNVPVTKGAGSSDVIVSNDTSSNAVTITPTTTVPLAPTLSPTYGRELSTVPTDTAPLSLNPTVTTPVPPPVNNAPDGAVGQRP